MATDVCSFRDGMDFIPAGLSDVSGVPLSEASPLVSFGLGTGVEESLLLN
jgi:hypothetical protein